MHQTIYEYAFEQMQATVKMLLVLATETDNFQTVHANHWVVEEQKEALLCGKGFLLSEVSIIDPASAWMNRLAVPFDLEQAATGPLYRKIEAFTDELIERAFAETRGFELIDAEWIHSNPNVLPVLMHVAGVFSKQNLAKTIGAASDKAISKPASVRLAELIKSIGNSNVPAISDVKQRIKATVEGIVRDVVGRLLLEDFVAAALDREAISFLRESDYESLSGVVYDFRADFVIPNPESPSAFIEVRKSSARHASLYAKDKMFSAINWKGRHPKCIGVLVVDGPWTDVTLKIMSKVFDYVVPIGKVSDVARVIRSYVDGDERALRWLIQFHVEPFGGR